MTEDYGGPVNSDASYFRDADTILRYGTEKYVTCHQCGSGEVHTPMQAAVLPTVSECLYCGEVAPGGEF